MNSEKLNNENNLCDPQDESSTDKDKQSGLEPNFVFTTQIKPKCGIRLI